MGNPLKKIFAALFKPAAPDGAGGLTALSRAVFGAPTVETASLLTPPDMSVLEFDRNPDLLNAIYDHVRKSASDTLLGDHLGYAVAFDVTNLGMINRLYGEEVGTAFLKVAAQSMTNYLKYVDDRTDVRYLHHSGGDEFIVILQGRLQKEKIEEVLEKSAALFEEYVVIKNGLHQLPHLKHAQATGAGIAFRVARILPTSPDYDIVADRLYAEMAEEKGSIEMKDAQTVWSNGSPLSRASVAAYESETLRAEILRMIQVNTNGIQAGQKLPVRIRIPDHAPTFDGIGNHADERAAIDALKTPGAGGVLRVEIGSLGKVNEKYGREAADGIIARLAGVIRQETADQEGVSLFRPAGGAFDIVIKDPSPDSVLDLQHRIYGRLKEDVFKHYAFHLKDTGLLFPYARAVGADETLQLLSDMGRLQALHDVSFIDGDTVYPVNPTRQGKRPLEGRPGAAALAIPFAPALRTGLEADELERVLLKTPEDISLFLYGARDAEPEFAALGSRAARFLNLLRYDVPSLHQELYTDMLAHDSLPPPGVESVMRALVSLKQAAHVYNDDTLLDGKTLDAFKAVYSVVSEEFSNGLKARGEAHLARLWAECHAETVAPKIDNPLQIVSAAVQKLADKIESAGVLRQSRSYAEETRRNIEDLGGKLQALKILVNPGHGGEMPQQGKGVSP